jgi:hypothetical protein
MKYELKFALENEPPTEEVEEMALLTIRSVLESNFKGLRVLSLDKASTPSLKEAADRVLRTADDPHEEAMRLFRYFRERFGWAGTVFTRADVETQVDRLVTDDEWRKVSSTQVWQDMGGLMCDSGAWDWVDEAIEQSGIPSEVGG